MSETRWSLRRIWLSAFAAATVAGAYYALQTWLFLVQQDGRVTSPTRTVYAQMSFWYVWAAFAPGLVWWFRRAPIDRARWMRTVVVHLAAAVAFAIAYGIVSEPLYLVLIGSAPPKHGTWALRIAWFVVLALPGNLVQVLVFDVCHQAIAFARALRERDVAAARLSAELANAELRALKLQLEPHFIFNTLNAISAYVENQPSVATEMIARLGAFLRLVLGASGTQEVALSRELELVREYLAVHRLRFGERLTVSYEIDAETNQAIVPSMVLQPLVENALRHGVGAVPGPGHVTLAARRVHDDRVGDALALIVEDSGPGLVSDSGVRGADGIGLANTRTRLAQLYGERHALTLSRAADGGARVTVLVPFRAITLGDESAGRETFAPRDEAARELVDA